MTEAELLAHQQRSTAWCDREAAACASWEALLEFIDGPSPQKRSTKLQQEEGRCSSPPAAPAPMQHHGMHDAAPVRCNLPPHVPGQHPGRHGRPAAGPPSAQQHGYQCRGPRRGWPASHDVYLRQQRYHTRHAPGQQALVYGPIQQEGPPGAWPPVRYPVQHPMHAPTAQRAPILYGPNAQQQGFYASHPSQAMPAGPRPPHAARTYRGMSPVPMVPQYGDAWRAPGIASSAWP